MRASGLHAAATGPTSAASPGLASCVRWHFWLFSPNPTPSSCRTGAVAGGRVHGSISLIQAIPNCVRWTDWCCMHWTRAFVREHWKEELNKGVCCTVCRRRRRRMRAGERVRRSRRWPSVAFHVALQQRRRFAQRSGACFTVDPVLHLRSCRTPSVDTSFIWLSS